MRQTWKICSSSIQSDFIKAVTSAAAAASCNKSVCLWLLQRRKKEQISTFPVFRFKFGVCFVLSLHVFVSSWFFSVPFQLLFRYTFSCNNNNSKQQQRKIFFIFDICCYSFSVIVTISSSPAACPLSSRDARSLCDMTMKNLNRSRKNAFHSNTPNSWSFLSTQYFSYPRCSFFPFFFWDGYLFMRLVVESERISGIIISIVVGAAHSTYILEMCRGRIGKKIRHE